MFSLVISKPALAKIKEWCTQLPDSEWSGTLFYRIKEGSFAEKNLVLEAVDFYVSDIGSSVFTSFETSPDILTYQDENDLLDCYAGMLHSHDKLSAFFSGTDESTLKKEGASMNHFLSLVVNNSGPYCARLTYKEMITQVKVPSFDCSEAVFTPENAMKVKWVNLNIILDEDTALKDSVAQRISEIMATKTPVAEPTFFNDLPESGDLPFIKPAFKPAVVSSTFTKAKEYETPMPVDEARDKAYDLAVQVLRGSVIPTDDILCDSFVAECDEVWKNYFPSLVDRKNTLTNLIDLLDNSNNYGKEVFKEAADILDVYNNQIAEEAAKFIREWY